MKRCLACGQRFEAGDWRCPGCGQSPERWQGYPLFAPDMVDGDGSDAEYKYAELFAVEAGNFWFRSRNRLVIWALLRYFPRVANFLEIGCGTGFVLSGIRQELPGLHLSASDILIRGLAYVGKRLPGVSLFQMDARRIPFEAEFDVIGAFDMLEHIQEDEAVLLEMFRAAKPGGGILLTVPHHRFLWSFLDEFGHHKRRYIRSELVEKVERAGFEVVRITSFVSFLLPLLLLSRLRQHAPPENCDPMAEFRVNRLLNVMLEKILGIEQALIRRGVSLPVGGSLLVVAKRPTG